MDDDGQEDQDDSGAGVGPSSQDAEPSEDDGEVEAAYDLRVHLLELLTAGLVRVLVHVQNAILPDDPRGYEGVERYGDDSLGNKGAIITGLALCSRPRANLTIQ